MYFTKYIQDLDLINITNLMYSHNASIQHHCFVNSNATHLLNFKSSQLSVQHIHKIIDKFSYNTNLVNSKIAFGFEMMPVKSYTLYEREEKNEGECIYWNIASNCRLHAYINESTTPKVFLSYKTVRTYVK